MASQQGVLLGIAGLAGSGKTTLAQYLVSEYRKTTGREDVRCVGLADPIKLMFARLFDPEIDPIDALYLTDRLKRDGRVQLCDGYGSRPIYKVGVRSALQRMGTEAGREVLGAEVWMNHFIENFDPDQITIVHDIRMAEEAQMIEQLGGYLLNVVRAGVKTGPHPTEEGVEVRSYWAPNAPVGEVIVNDGAVEDLRQVAQRIVTEHPAGEVIA